MGNRKEEKPREPRTSSIRQLDKYLYIDNKCTNIKRVNLGISFISKKKLQWTVSKPIKPKYFRNLKKRPSENHFSRIPT